MPEKSRPSDRAEKMVWLEGGAFAMGSEDFYPDEGPVRSVDVEGFWISRYTVTNGEFTEFVESTGYVTEAERDPDPALYPGALPEFLVPAALVFRMTEGPVPLDDYRRWWELTPGANWRHPHGPESSLEGLSDHPVVQVSFGDASAFCDWAGLELPTEAEWEFAARGGLDGATFAWGDDDQQETEPVANTWQGRFPYQNTEVDGWTRTAPVGSYPPNGYGLFDVAGNVWEWTTDWYTSQPGATESPCCGGAESIAMASEQSMDPAMPEIRIPRKVVKGGSHLCTPQYCYRYRPAARQPQMIDTAMSHIGFRCVYRGSKSG